MLAVAVGLLGLVVGARVYAGSDYETAAGWVRDQPVPFSHKHHVADEGIDCRFCHAGAERGARAGLPPTHTCMTCHSQLWTGAAVLAPVRQSLATGRPIGWRRVAELPDYVHFDHSIHVARGVACLECHGAIDRMPLTWRAKPFEMRFCLECHRDPAPHLGPPEQVTRTTSLGWSAQARRRYGEGVMRAHRIDPARLQDCGICHR